MKRRQIILNTSSEGYKELDKEMKKELNIATSVYRKKRLYNKIVDDFKRWILKQEDTHPRSLFKTYMKLAPKDEELTYYIYWYKAIYNHMFRVAYDEVYPFINLLSIYKKNDTIIIK